MTVSAALGAPRALRWSQWNAVRALDGHVLVTAGAGTGKTFTVVSAILYLLGIEIRTPDGTARVERPLDLSEVAAITFTNQAAADLKRGLRAALREHGRGDLARRVDGARVGTIHRFCGDVLREFALRTGRDPALRVMEEGEAAALVRTTAREALVEAVEGGSPDAARLLGTHAARDVEAWIAELLDQSDILRALASSPHLEEDAGALVSLARRASSTLDRTLDDLGAVDFDRMVVWTRDLLRDDSRALRALRRRVRVLIIDEFQDVDPAQKDIAYLLGGLDPGGLAGSDGPAAAPDNVTRLCLVGDPKQSIYRFRRADVSVWTRVERDFETGRGTVVPLDESFRSAPEILGWIDATSGARLDEPLDGVAHADYEVGYRPLRPTRPGRRDAAVEVLILPAGRDGKRLSPDVARRAEAAWIARRARAFHDDGVAWRDMALLIPAWAPVAHYEDTFAAAGIPAYTVRGEGFLERREVVDMITALQAIRTPRDDRALFGFLRGPFVGVRDDTLLRVARHAARPYWRAIGPEWDGDEAAGGGEGPLHPGGLAATAEEAELLRGGAALIAELGALRDRVSTAELLEHLLERTGYVAHLALAGTAGREAIANARQFLGMARDAADRSVGDFLADIEGRRARERERASREIPARLYAEDDDVLTITTIHGAKGLEWSVVFCADIARQWRGEPGAFLRVGDRLLLGDPDLPSKDRPEPWPTLADRLKAEDRAERKRQWYVAQSRARDRLLLASIPLGQKPGTGSFARELTDAFPVLGGALAGDTPADGAGLPYTDARGVERMARIAVMDLAQAEAAGAGTAESLLHGATAPPGMPVRGGSNGGMAPNAATDADGPREAREALAEPPPGLVPLAGPLRLSATQMLVRSRCETRHHLKYVLGIPEPDATRAGDDPLIRGVVRGRIVHEVLHRYRDPEELADVIEVAIGRWDEHAPPPDTDRGARYRAEVRGEVDRVLALPEYAGLWSDPGARRELAFLHVHPDGRSTEGAIDVAVAPGRDAAGWRLVDVKTNRVDADGARAAAQRYSPQRDVYADAVGSISGEDVDAFTFVFSGPGVAVGGPVPSGAGLRTARAREALAGAVRPALAEDPSECVFCGYRVVGLCPGVVRGVEAARREPEGGSASAPGETEDARREPEGAAASAPRGTASGGRQLSLFD